MSTLMKERRSTRFIPSFLLLVALTISTACVAMVPPVFSGGIRVKAFEGITGATGLALFPIPSVPNRGRMLTIIGPGNGSLTTFIGATNALGTSDYPTARTNANWSVGVGPSTAPPCAAIPFIEPVPPAGAEFVSICFV